MNDFAAIRLTHELSMHKLERDIAHVRRQSLIELDLAYHEKAKQNEISNEMKHYLNSERRSNHSFASNQTAKSTQTTSTTHSKRSNHSIKSTRSNAASKRSSNLTLASKSSTKWTAMQPETCATAKMYKLFFDMSRYAPTEISVRVEGEYLYVYARHDGVRGKKLSFHEFERKHRLPPNCDPLLMRASLSLKGLLTVYAFTYNRTN